MRQEEKCGKRIHKNVTEEVIDKKLFIIKKPNQDHEGETFIADSGAISHMVNSEENMANLNNSETQVTVGDSINLTGKTHGDWNGYQRRGKKVHNVML